MPAITPYNFVPLPDSVLLGEQPPPADRFDPERHSGWFDIEITTLTPVYTRAARRVTPLANVDPDAQPEEFFSSIHRGKPVPVLPGSSLRGMVRSLFEIITCSQMEFITERRFFFRSFASTITKWRDYYVGQFHSDKLVAGVLKREDNQWFLDVSNEATTPGVESHSGVAPDGDHRGFLAIDRQDPAFHTVKDIREVLHSELTANQRPTFQAFQYKAATPGEPVGMLRNPENLTQPAFMVGKTSVNTTGPLEGWLIAPGKDIGAKEDDPGPRNFFQFILAPGSACRRYPVPKPVYDDYREWGRLAHGNKFGTQEAPRFLGEDQPAFALLTQRDGDWEVEVIGANLMMPLRYKRSIQDAARIGEPAADVALDMTQAVFGRVWDRRRHGAMASPGQNPEDPERQEFIRGRVYFEDAECKTENPWLDGTSSPVVRVPDVLSSPKPTSFQAYLVQDQENGDRNHWDSANAKIRGHKRYWHRSPDAARNCLHTNIMQGVNPTQTTRITPVRECVQFTGRVRFENLSDRELGALYASIHLPEGLAHKIGMGKNIGLGSIQVKVTSSTLLKMSDRYKSLLPDTGKLSPQDAERKLSHAYAAFVGQVNPNKTSLWTSGRMKALAALLSWDCKPGDDSTRQVGVDNDDNAGQWRYRYILPEAFGVAPAAYNQPITDVFTITAPAVRQAPHPPTQPEPWGEAPVTAVAHPGVTEHPDAPAADADQPESPAEERSPDQTVQSVPPTLAGPDGQKIQEESEETERSEDKAIDKEIENQVEEEAKKDQDSAKPTPPPAEPVKPQYDQGDKIMGTIIALSGMGGIVGLEDGTNVKVAVLVGVQQGEKRQFKILDVGGDGKVKKLGLQR